NFPAAHGIDAFYGSWNGANGNFYTANGSTNSNDVTGSCSVATGNQGGFVRHSEIRCPWTVFGFTNPVYPGAGVPEINVFTAIMGGDDTAGGGDVAPNGPATGGGITVGATHFANAGVGPTAVSLSSFTAQTTPTLPLLLVFAGLMIGGAVWIKRK
ncbi:MAG: hypothetical protein R6X34_16365, partial [Chloroflexota bacterium]